MIRERPIEIRDIARLNINPGEVLVVTLPNATPTEDQQQVRAKIEKELPGVKMIIKSESVEMWVLSGDGLRGPATEYTAEQWNART